MKKIILLLATIVLICTSCSNEQSSYWLPGKIVSDQLAADKALRVVVILGEDKGDYLIQLYGADTSRVVTEKKVSAPVGYHAPIITVDWSKSPQKVFVEINHDFGDSNKIVELVGN